MTKDGGSGGRSPSGLGYTTWAYDGVTAAADGGGARVRVRVRNTGARAGRDVVQVYASRPGSTLERPVRWLAGAAVVAAGPGDEAVADVVVRPRVFEHWDVARGRWAVEPGEFVLEVGPSSVVLPLRAAVSVAPRG